MVENLTTDTFKEKIFDFENAKEWMFKGNKPAIIDFAAEWCGPCKMVGPIINELSDEIGDKIDFFKVDVDEEHQLASMLGIKSIPTIIFIPLKGEPKASVGAMTKSQMLKAIKDNLGVE
ncbi:MAG: thioredoxin [Nanoarchaeota archaeon]